MTAPIERGMTEPECRLLLNPERHPYVPQEQPGCQVCWYDAGHPLHWMASR